MLNYWRGVYLITIIWITPFKFIRLPTKFLSMHTFAKRGPGNIENLQETGQMFLNTSEKNQMVGP